ncbi:MAG: imidazolonepropionase [Gemmatimonadaceae bacterium]|nr:imidazolonepropionase [Gemmatimonadaceae bacterium]
MTYPAHLLVRNIGTLVSPAGAGAQRGADFGRLDVRHDVEVAVRQGEVVHVGPAGSWRDGADRTIDAAGRAMLPALVDPHTHLVWGGDRLDDFEARVRGESYEAILARGGGIRHTMRETAIRDEDELVATALPRLEAMVRAGAATIECKSGYGGDVDVERRQLRAVRRLAAAHRAELVPTMLFHVPPGDAALRAGWLEHACRDFIPAIAAESLAIDIDVFVEREAFTVDEARALVTAARAHGLGAHLHADQFHAIGGVELGVELGVHSVDHLEASGAAQVAALAASRTVAVVLPGVTLHLGLPPAPVRALVDAGAIVAIGTDCNPGSSPLFSMQLAMALAVRLYRLTPAEALVAATVNAAAALGFSRTGRIVEGAVAQFVILESRDWRDVAYALGGDVIASTLTRTAVSDS